jgi:methionyl-tRNA synthetase
MHVALQIAAALSSICEPFLPHSAQKLRGILNIDSPLTWETIANESTLLKAQHIIGEQTLLFSKIEDDVIAKQLEKLAKTKEENEQQEVELPPIKETITFDDFSKLDLRVGTITAAEKVKKAKKLLQLQVELGNETRTIVSGIAESFSPEEVVGQQVTVLTNLAPRTIRGVESQGMLLMSENTEGKMVFISPDKGGENGFPIH